MARYDRGMMRRKSPGRPPHPDILTPAEWRVAEGVRHGLSNPAIAMRINVSTDSVKFHVSNILTKLGFTSRRELRQWNGVNRATNLGVSGLGLSGNTAAFGAIGQIARHVSDVEAATMWYRDILGLQHLYSFPGLSFFDCDGTRLFLSEGAASANSVLYFRVDDIVAAHGDMVARNVEFVAAPHMIHRHEDGTEEWMAFFNDCEGQLLAIMMQLPSKLEAG